MPKKSDPTRPKISIRIHNTGRNTEKNHKMHPEKKNNKKRSK
jgi:hypothetical protein